MANILAIQSERAKALGYDTPDGFLGEARAAHQNLILANDSAFAFCSSHLYDSDMNYTDVDQKLGILVALLISSGQVTEDRLGESLHPIELSPIKFWALNHLVAADEPLPLSEIAERLHCARSNCTQLIDRLEAEGLVHRIHDPHDRRMVRAELTPAGRRRFEEGVSLLEEPTNELRDMFDPAEREQLANLLARVRERWG